MTTLRHLSLANRCSTLCRNSKLPHLKRSFITSNDLSFKKPILFSLCLVSQTNHFQARNSLVSLVFAPETSPLIDWQWKKNSPTIWTDNVRKKNLDFRTVFKVSKTKKKKNKKVDCWLRQVVTDGWWGKKWSDIISVNWSQRIWKPIVSVKNFKKTSCPTSQKIFSIQIYKTCDSAHFKAYSRSQI